jgi:predicted transcriptional regulator
MKHRSDHNAATYNPQQFKTFAGALAAYFAAEFPQLAGDRMRRALVQGIIEMVERFYPETTHLRPGQIQWTTIDKNEKPSWGKRTSQCKLTSVILDLVRSQDVGERAEGKKLREIKKEAVARLFDQAYDQGGCMTNAELAVLLKISAPTVSKYAREWENENGELLPRRGTVHDMGPTLTHKRQIIRKLFIEKKTVQQVSRETHHSPEAIHRYITACKQILLCRSKGLTSQEIAYGVRMSLRLVEEYQRLIDQMADISSTVRKLLNMDGVTGT